jgi:hypothetical protein
MKAITCNLMGLLWCSQVVGATPPPDDPRYDAITWPMSMRAAPAPAITLGNFRIVFEVTTLGEVKAKIGSGTVSHRGDAARSEYWLCYTAVSPHRNERLWVISNAEMGGPSNAITHIEAISLLAPEASDDCPRLPSQLMPIALDSKLWLGSTAGMLTDILGSPSHEAPPWRSYNFWTKVSSDGQCEGGYDLLNALDVALRNDVVVTISAGQVTSC